MQILTWEPIVIRFEMTLSIDVPRLIAAHAEDFISTLLQNAGLDLQSDKDDIIWVIHPGGPAIVDLVGSCLRLSNPAPWQPPAGCERILVPTRSMRSCW